VREMMAKKVITFYRTMTKKGQFLGENRVTLSVAPPGDLVTPLHVSDRMCGGTSINTTYHKH